MYAESDMEDPIKWNLERAWEHIAAVVKLTNQRDAPKDFVDELEEVTVGVAGLKGLAQDLESETWPVTTDEAT